MPNPKRLFLAVGALALVAAAIFLIGKNLHRQPAGVGNQVPTVRHNQAATLPHHLPSVPAQPSSKPQQKDAVTAAALAMSNLSESQLLPPDQISQVIGVTVVPTKRTKLERAYKLTGQALAKFLGYASVDQTRLAAGYYVTVEKYRVGFYQPPKATIWLYTLTHWINSQNYEYYIPSITVVQMRFVGSQWLYVSSGDPPSNLTPKPVDNLSTEQLVQRFQPYLKGFKPYEGA